MELEEELKQFEKTIDEAKKHLVGLSQSSPTQQVEFQGLSKELEAEKNRSMNMTVFK